MGPKEIAGVFYEVYESSISRKKNAGEEDSFPLQQKLALCTLMLLARHVKCKEVHLGKVRHFDSSSSRFADWHAWFLRPFECVLQSTRAGFAYFMPQSTIVLRK